MPKGHENSWKARLVRDLRKAGATVLSLHGHAQQAPGWPDIYVAHKVWSGWLELKGPNKWLSEAQSVVMRKLVASGVPCFVLEAHSTQYDICRVKTRERHELTNCVSYTGFELLQLLRFYTRKSPEEG